MGFVLFDFFKKSYCEHKQYIHFSQIGRYQTTKSLNMTV